MYSITGNQQTARWFGINFETVLVSIFRGIAAQDTCNLTAGRIEGDVGAVLGFVDEGVTAQVEHHAHVLRVPEHVDAVPVAVAQPSPRLRWVHFG